MLTKAKCLYFPQIISTGLCATGCHSDSTSLLTEIFDIHFHMGPAKWNIVASHSTKGFSFPRNWIRKLFSVQWTLDSEDKLELSTKNTNLKLGSFHIMIRDYGSLFQTVKSTKIPESRPGIICHLDPDMDKLRSPNQGQYSDHKQGNYTKKAVALQNIHMYFKFGLWFWWLLWAIKTFCF